MKKPFFVLATLVVIIVGMLVVRSVISNRISTSGLALGKTQDELKKYRTQNFLLREQIYSLSSLSHISSAAAKIGFVESRESFALGKARPIARGQ